MRAFLTVLAAALITAGAWAQSPLKMSYQAVIRNTSDQLVINQPIGMRISILQGSAMGVAVYTETQVTSTNTIGLVSIEIGGGAGFDAIEWANGPYFIKTETDPEGGTNYTITNTSQLLSVPYALHAKTAEALSGGITETDPVFGASPAKTISGSDIANWNNKQDKLTTGNSIVFNGDTISATGLPPNGTAPGEMLYWNGIAWVAVPPGTHGKKLYFCNGVPTWGGCPSLLTTASVYGITTTTATSGGFIANDGGSPVTARGVCWSTLPNPTIADNHTMGGADTGKFVSSLTNLIPNTMYYVRTYATNSAGTAYGNEVSFTTSPINESTVCYSEPDGVIASGIYSGWSYKDYLIPEGYKVDSVFMDASRPGYPQDEYDFILGYCAGLTSYNPSAAMFPLDYTAITSPMYKTWLNLTNHSIKSSGVVRVTLPTCNGAVWNALCFAISPLKHSTVCFAAPDGTNDYNWSYKDYVIPEGYRVDSMYMDASRPGYTPDKYDLLIAYCPGANSYNSSSVTFLFEYESVTTPMYNTWLNLTKMSVKATGMVRVKLPTHERAVWNNLCIAISEITVPIWSCGSPITIKHKAGSVAPVTKTVTYGTTTNIPGDPSKCWITQNLGSDHQATSIDDATEASAGWYWQFNHKQGYKHDGTIRTPNTSWIGSIREYSDWTSATDPCALELGNGWRIPTKDEWNNVCSDWKVESQVYSTISWIPWIPKLRLHSGGYLVFFENGTISNRGITGEYWSNTQFNEIYGWYLSFPTYSREIQYGMKESGFNIRCITGENTTDAMVPKIKTTDIRDITSNSATSGGELTNDGGAAIINRGICWSTLSNPTITDSHTEDGSGSGEFVSNLTNLTPNTGYYVRAYATNKIGTAYGNEVNFVTLPWVCSSSITIKHMAGIVAPVSKTVTYGTVSNIPGEPTKCWITQNLGADHQATAVDDATEESAGWYWQFNRKQGYKHDGTTRTPNTTWFSSIDENSDWIPGNDPCSLELGSGWRIPTSVEWTNLDATGNWTSSTDPWNSNLKLHNAGDLSSDNGSNWARGSGGYYWSQTGYYGNAEVMLFQNDLCSVRYLSMAGGFTLRCLKDPGSQASNPTVITTEITSISYTSASVGGEATSDGGAVIGWRGVCWSTIPNPTIDNYHSFAGIGIGAFICNLTNLYTGTLYYARAFAKNNEGIGYGDEVNFTTKSAGYSIGQAFGGGRIFYIDSTGQHGLIADTTNSISIAEWGCDTIYIGTRKEIGSGLSNTIAIVNNCSQPGTAAQLCYDLVLNGYDDWFLPSLGELVEYYRAPANINGLEKFSSLSSTETNSGTVFYYYYGQERIILETYKTDKINVLAVRAF